jgi:hypothetical protein
MKKLLLFTFAVLFSWTAFSQESSYYDDFESYTVGSYIAVNNPDWWTTWSNLPGSAEDGEISNAQYSSPTKSVLVDKVPAETDLILKLGNKTSGAYELTWDMYVATGNAGYFNIQHFESPGIEWAYEVYFLANGNGELLAGSTTPFTFTYPKNAWFLVENLINIDEDLVTLVIDGVEVLSWPFSYQADDVTGTNQLGGVDFFAGAKTGETPKYYFDNLDFKPMAITLYEDDFESYNVLDYIAESNPTWWTTWGNVPGTGEDGYVSDDFAHSPTQSIFIDPDDGLTDLILKLGNKTSGVFFLEWYVYVEAGYQGYYNVQHFESPGIEWAYDVWFYDDGTGELMVGNIYYPFTYTQGTWTKVENYFNIDEDMASLTIGGTEVHSWPFSYQTQETTGTNQLGGVDFWTDDATYRCYIDDLSFTQLGAAQEPSISIDPAFIEATAAVGESVTVPMTITNSGSADLTYEIGVLYPAANQSAPIAFTPEHPAPARSLGYVTENSTDPNYRPAAYNPVNRDFLLHYDGDNANAYSWGPNPPYTIVNAAMFPPSLTLPHTGMYLSSVIMFFGADVGTNCRVRVYGPGNGYQPGAMLVDQPFTPAASTWTEVELDNPVFITGGELWIGYQYTQPTADLYIVGVDAGPNNINGDWISFNGISWNHLTDYEDNVNWNIRGMLTGTPMEQWLSVAPVSGTVAPGESVTIDVTCDAAGLEAGMYDGLLRVVNNDQQNAIIEVPVAFEVTEGGTMTSIILDFEAQEDWSLTFDQWTTADVDGSNTYGITDVTFPHSGEPMAFIAFNPATTTPSLADDPALQPHGGVRFGACMASGSPTYLNDDWLISPQVTLGMNSSLTFWAKSYTDEWGLERYNVLVSTTDNDPASFTAISDPPYMEAPLDWTEMEYDLSAYDGQTIYVAIQDVTADAFIFMVDDISIDYYTGTPEMEEVTFSIYPNPVINELNITSGVEMTQVEIINQLGQKVYSQVVKDNVFNLKTNDYESGVYYVRITTEQGVSTEKFMIK